MIRVKLSPQTHITDLDSDILLQLFNSEQQQFRTGSEGEQSLPETAEGVQGITT